MFFLRIYTGSDVRTCSADYLSFSRSLLGFLALASCFWEIFSTPNHTTTHPILIDDPGESNAKDESDQISTGHKVQGPILLDEIEADKDRPLDVETSATQAIDAGDSLLVIRREVEKQPEEMVPLPPAILSIVNAFVTLAENNSGAFEALFESPKQKYDKFTLFPNLPPELRIMVWRHTFPKPRIIFLDHVCNTKTRLEIQQTLGIENFQMFPTTLHVSKESRGETLKMYHVVYSRWARHTLCFDPVRDFVSISFVMLQAISHSLREYFLEIDFERAYLKSIRSLDIWDACWFDDTMAEISNEEPQLPHAVSPTCCSLRLFLLFPNLKEIRVHFRETRYTWQPRLRDRFMEECKVLFTSYLEHHADSFEGADIPRVIVRGIERMKGTF